MALNIDEIKQMIPGMLQTAWKPQDTLPEYEPGPATLEDVRRFEVEKGMVLSKDVIDWMLMTNGIFRGPAGLNGISGYMSLGVGEERSRYFRTGNPETGFRWRRTDSATAG